MYYIKIIEELCWAKHLPLNTLCAYLDYMTFWLTTEKDIKKRLYVNYSKIINNKNLGPSGPWAKYSDNTGQNVDLIKRQYFFFPIKKPQKTDNFVTHFRSQNKKKINKKYFHSHCMGKDWMSISMLVFKYGKLWINMNETQQMEYTNTRTAYHTFSVTHSKALFTFFPGRKVFILQLIKFSTFHFCLLWGTHALLTFHRIGLGHCLLLLGGSCLFCQHIRQHTETCQHTKALSL